MSRSMTVTSTKFHAFRLFCQSVSSSSSRASHSRTKRQSFQAGYSFLGLHSIDGADRHEVAINEIIQTPRLQLGPESRECDGTRTRPDDQDGFHGVHKKSPAPHSGRTRLTFEYRQAPVGSRCCAQRLSASQRWAFPPSREPANNWVSPTHSLNLLDLLGRGQHELFALLLASAR